MRTMMALILLLWVAGAVHAQNMQIGTKTAEQMVVAYSVHESPTATFMSDMQRAFNALWSATSQRGLHPLGLPIICFDVPTIETGTARWEAWLPLVDALDPVALEDRAEPTLKLVPATRVVFTYHLGMPEQLAQDLAALRVYAKAEGLVATTQARIVAYVSPREGNSFVLEHQLEVEQ